MSELVAGNSQIYKTAQEHCDYCQAVLSPAYYFCYVCGTPYKPFELVTGRVAYQPVESEQIRQKTPQVWSVFWSYAVIIFVLCVMYYLMDDHEHAEVYTLITGSALFFILTAFFEIKYWRSLVVQLKRIGFFHKTAMMSFAILPFILLLNYLYHYVVIGNFVEIEHIQAAFEKAHLGFMVQLVLICVFPAITEEIAFRGLIQHWLQTAILPWRAIVLASALFAALHLSVLSAPYLFLVGLLLGWVKWKTGSLYPSMLLHFLHNAVVVFVFPYI